MSQNVCQAYHPSIFDEEEDIPTEVYQRDARLTKPDPYTIMYGGAVAIFGAILLMLGYILSRIIFG